MERNSEKQLKETSRIEAFSDGIFSIAITLLIIELVQILHTKNDKGIINLLLHNWQYLFAFMIGFLTILVCWINHHLVFTYIRKVDSKLMWVNAFVLFMVAFAPFPTAVLAEYFESERHMSLAFFGLNYVLIALAAYCISAYVYRKSLIDNSSKILFRKFVTLYKYSVLYTLVAFGTCFLSVIVAIIMYGILFIVFAFPKEASAKFIRHKQKQ
jgi:TMEM175 potassium channel family protein